MLADEVGHVGAGEGEEDGDPAQEVGQQHHVQHDEVDADRACSQHTHQRHSGFAEY